ncbi:MAG: carbohydrate-binding protein [Oliverpabstia sp.]
MFCLKVLDAEWKTIAVARGEDEVNLMCSHTYQPGDRIILESAETDVFLWLQFDDALGRSMIYLKDSINYEIPFGEKRINLSPKAFMGNKHLITAKRAKKFEIGQYRNLAYSVVDHHQNTTYFPHITANVETRGEAVFAAQNAIDGVTINTCHGEWPFESWGINRQADAKIRLEFGRKVKIDRIILYIRADFPHDNWWKQAEFTFSDNSSMTVDMKKTGQAQEFTMEPKIVTWLELGNLIQSEEPSPFPALTQIEVYGTEAEGE